LMFSPILTLTFYAVLNDPIDDYSLCFRQALKIYSIDRIVYI
jgi:hypothetical protein